MKSNYEFLKPYWPALAAIRKMEEVCLCADLPRFIYWVVRGTVLLQKLNIVKWG